MEVRLLALVLASVLVLSLAPLPVTAEDPYADAGLDQTVTKGATVQLDATGSTDPDGSIQGFEWILRTPDGTTATPDCPTCGETSFVAASVGTYEVTVTVTDDDGDTASDTLYVEVEPGEPPSLVLTGPSSLQTGQTGTYVAEADSGDADLDRIVWSIDGSVVDTQDVTGDTATVSLDRQFATTGTRHVTAHVVDEDDQRDTESVATAVQQPPQNTGGSGGAVAGPSGQTGSRGTASIVGPTIITGAEPLTGDYQIDGNSIRDVTWWKDGTQVATGTSYSTPFQPGIHHLHASVTYTDGSTDIARFPGDTTRVEADPEPQITVDTLDGTGGLTADTVATDGFGNLERFELRLDDQVVLAKGTNPLKLQHDPTSDRFELAADTASHDPGWYDAELIATDTRGQEVREWTRLHIKGPPEVVSAGFEEPEDLDVYHPRIDPERYTAKHVVEIELNGVLADDITVDWNNKRKIEDIKNSHCQPAEELDGKILEITSCWAPLDIQESKVTLYIRWVTSDSDLINQEYSIEPTPSDPELRYRVISGGAAPEFRHRGLVVDATDSFDPDGTTIIYEWGDNAEALPNNPGIGKLDDFRESEFYITDGNGGRTDPTDVVIGYFNPEIKETRQLSSGPYVVNDEVVYEISSRSYMLAKNRYREFVDIRLVPSNGEVVNHDVYNGPYAGQAGRVPSRPEDFSGDFDQQQWIVRIPASVFLESTPSFKTFNTYQKERTTDTYEFPKPYILLPGEPYATDTDVERKFVVREPQFSTTSTVQDAVRASLLEQGYNVYRTELSGKEWQFERQEKVSEAVYRTDHEEFSTSGSRSLFLELHPEWEANGSRVERNTVTKVDREWRNIPSGDGAFTGNTRETLIQPAQYRTERKYEYQYTETETRTRTRTKTYQYQETVTYQTTETECNRYIGCYERTVTKTKDVTRTRTIEYQENYEAHVTKTGSYWSTTKRGGSHTYTGDSRRVKVESAEYETQYEFEIEHTETVEERIYMASKTELVEPAEYEWLPYQTTRSELVADELQMSDDIRVSTVEDVEKWSLRKQTGWTESVSSTYKNKSSVIQTRINVSGTIVEPHLDPDTLEVVHQNETELTYQYNVPGYEDRSNVIETFINQFRGEE